LCVVVAAAVSVGLWELGGNGGPEKKKDQNRTVVGNPGLTLENQLLK